IAGLVNSNREGLLETALDLEMSANQFMKYVGQVSAFDAIPSVKDRASSVRAFQSAFELIRLVVRKGWLDKVKLASIVDRLLALHPGEGRYVYDLLAIVIKDVVGPDDGVDGGQPEEKLLSLLADPQSVSINAADAVRPNVADDATFDYFQYDMSMAD